MSLEWLSIVMLAVMIASLFIGIPVSFTLIFLALGFGFYGQGISTFDLAYVNLLGSLKDDIMISIPLFIFMGYICEKAGLVEKLFDSLKKIFAPVPGSLYFIVIVISVLISLATGVVGAAVTILGIMAVPSMLKSGYDPKLSAGVIAGGGSLIMIPPAVPLIVMAPTLGININDLYAASFAPGFLIATMYMIFCSYMLWKNPSLGPSTPIDQREPISLKTINDALLDIIPLLFLILVTLGSMIAGIATSTEASAFGAFGALTLSILHKRLSLKNLHQSLLNTVNTSAVVMLLAIASGIFGSVFAALGGDKLITEMLLGWNVPNWLLLASILVLCYILGWPFEWPVIILVFLPIFIPILQMTGTDLVWFGAVLGVVIQTSYLTPPVALTGYYLKQVVPSWDIKLIFRAMMPFMWIQVAAAVILFLVPGISTWFPNYLNQKTQSTPIVITTEEKQVVKEQEVDFLGSFKEKQ
jgi:tripartite ATP-independent transporter DctM subunit